MVGHLNAPTALIGQPAHEGAGSASRGCGSLSAPDYGRHVRPVLIEPGHGFRPVHRALKRRERRIFERLLPEPVGGVVDELMQALVAGAHLETIGDPRAGPALPGDMHDAGRISLLEPGRRIKLDDEGVIDRVTGYADHVSPPVVIGFVNTSPRAKRGSVDRPAPD